MKIVNKKSILVLIMFSLFFVSCAQKKEVQEYNKPALYWYNKMLKQITNEYLEEADDTFTSLESEHKNSPLVPTAMLILSNAHIAQEEYELANYYLDEYSKRYALSKNIDFVRYLKIKANYLSIGYQYREQQLFIDTIADINAFKIKFPDSPYIHLVHDINSRLHMGKADFDKKISELYTRVGKDNASKLYLEKSKKDWSKPEEIGEIKVPWYRAIFENY